MFAIQLPTKVEYVQLLKTRESVIEFLKFRGDIKNIVSIDVVVENTFRYGGLFISGHTQRALFGDYVVKDGENFRIYSEEEFNKKYKKCQKP